MKRLLTMVAVIAVLVAAPIKVEAENAAFVISGGAWTDDGFSRSGGGFLTGFVFTIDESKGLYGRTLFHQFVVGVEPVQAVNIAALIKFDLGKKYGLYFNFGAEDYMGGDYGSAIIMGAGVEKTVWSGNSEDNVIKPWFIRVFGDVDFINNDIEAEDGKSLRLFFGITFTPVVKK